MTGEHTRDEILALGKVDPEFEEYLKEHPGPNTKDMDPLTMRRLFDDYGQKLVISQPVPEDIHEEDITVTARDGYKVPCRTHKPADGTRGPLFMVLHGGSFVLGAPWQEYQSCREFVRRFGATCVNVDYRLAPEYAFPIAIYDALDVLQWAAANAATLGADASRGFIVAGTSSGASLANTIAHLSKAANMYPALTGIYLSVPQVIARGAPPAKYRHEYLAWDQDKDGPFNNRKFSEKVYEAYKPDMSSPLYDSISMDHRGLPKVYMQACGMDHNRDDAIIYEHMLRTDAGVETRLDLYPGLPHAFWLLHPSFSKSKTASEDMYRGIAWLLGKN